MMIRRGVLKLLIASTALSSHAARAAEGEDANTIIVTAQKREQSAQEIPVSIAALSVEQIERQGISSLQELGNSVAGVNIAAINPGAMQLTIRGATDLSTSFQSSSVNGLYVDETVMSFVPGYMPEISLLDIDRVEVLRGPQGTLFGEGSEGGTIRVVTSKPDSTKTFGKVKLGAYATRHGGEGYAAQGGLNLPLVRDVLALRVTGGYRELPGWIDVPDLGVKDSNTAKLKDGRAALRLTPNDKLTVDAVYQMSRSKLFDFPTSGRLELNPRAVAAGNGLRLGAVGALSPASGIVDIAALTATYDFGGATLVSASSLTKSTFDSTRDLTTVYPATPFPAAILGGATAASFGLYSSKAFTQEVRLVSSDTNALKWTVGGFYKNENRVIKDGFIFNLPAIGLNDHPLSRSDQKGSSWAAFADLDYELTDALSVQAGLRYFHDSKTFRVEQLTGSSLPLGFAPAGSVQSGDNGANDTSPKLGLTYKASSNMLLFAKYSKGFRSGGANTVPIAQFPSAVAEYGPESLNAYELGMKSTFAGGWNANVYLFHNSLADVQLPYCTTEGQFYCTFTYVRNSGSAKADGLELELTGDVSRNLSVAFSYAYNNAKVTGNVQNASGGIQVGSKMPFNPDHKATIALHYERELSDGLTLGLDERYRWASKTYSDPANTENLANQPTSQLYLGASLSGGWGSFTLFADNVFDRDDTVIKGPAKVPVFVFANYVRPRNFGLEFKKQF